MLCSAIDIHLGGYYWWLKQPSSRRQKQDERLASSIKQFWLESGEHYGYRNIPLDLCEANIQCGRDRVLWLMTQLGLKALRGYKFPKGYYSGKSDKVTPNSLNREFDVAKPNQWWVSDITYIHTHEGVWFLALVMDLYARNIVGWSMSERMTDDIVLDAITMAYWRRKPKHIVKLHSDQGPQYTSRHFKQLLNEFNIEPSMSRRGNCWDEEKQDMFHYIEMFYNPNRRHTNNGSMTPNEYQRLYFKNLKNV